MLLQHFKETSSGHGVLRPGFWRLSCATCSIFLGFCSTLLITRTLGPAAFGRYSFALWLATVGVPAIGIGMSTRTSRLIADIQSRESPRRAAGVFYFVWKRQYSAILLYCLTYFLLTIPLNAFFGSNAPLLLLLLAGLSAPPLLLSGVASITLRSLRRFDLLETLHLFGALVMLLLIVMTTQIHVEQASAMLLASASALTLTLLLSLIYIVRLLPLDEALPPGPFLKDRLTRGGSNSLPLFLLDAIVWQRSELLLLASRSNAGALGCYALSVIISTHIMNTAPTLVSTCVLPMLFRYVPGRRYTTLYDAYIKTNGYLLVLTVPICLLTWLLCPRLILLCFGEAYLPAVPPLRILLIASAFSSISSVSLTHLVSENRRSSQIRLGLGTAILKIGLAFPLIALWGGNGAAIASASAQVVSALGSIVMCQRLLTSRNGPRSHWFYQREAQRPSRTS